MICARDDPMSPQGRKAAQQHPATLPAFADAESARPELFAFRDGRLGLLTRSRSTESDPTDDAMRYDGLAGRMSLFDTAEIT